MATHDTARTTRKRATKGLGAAKVVPAQTTGIPSAQVLDLAARDGLVRLDGYLLVRRHLDLAMAECEARSRSDADAAGELSAILTVRAFVHAEIERLGEQARVIAKLREAA